MLLLIFLYYQYPFLPFRAFISGRILSLKIIDVKSKGIALAVLENRAVLWSAARFFRFPRGVVMPAHIPLGALPGFTLPSFPGLSREMQARMTEFLEKESAPNQAMSPSEGSYSGDRFFT